MQKNGAGVHASVSCHWDTVTDGPFSTFGAPSSPAANAFRFFPALPGAHVVKWPGDKHKDHNRSMYCVITVSGLSF
jgi:hypothetical protein